MSGLTERISIPLADGLLLTAEKSNDPNYPRELYIGIEDKDHGWVQDLVIVQQTYRYKDDGQLDYNDRNFTVYLYEDNGRDDYTRSFSVDLREMEDGYNDV